MCSQGHSRPSSKGVNALCSGATSVSGGGGCSALSSPFTEPEISLYSRHGVATCPYRDPNNPVHTPIIMKIRFNIIFQSTSRSSKWSLSLTKNTAYVSVPETFMIIQCTKGSCDSSVGIVTVGSGARFSATAIHLCVLRNVVTSSRASQRGFWARGKSFGRPPAGADQLKIFTLVNWFWVERVNWCRGWKVVQWWAGSCTAPALAELSRRRRET